MATRTQITSLLERVGNLSSHRLFASKVRSQTGGVEHQIIGNAAGALVPLRVRVRMVQANERTEPLTPLRQGGQGFRIR